MMIKRLGRVLLILALALLPLAACKTPSEHIDVMAKKRYGLDTADGIVLYNGADITVYSDDHASSVWTLDGATGAMTSSSAISASGPLAIAGPTAVGTATPVLVVNQLGVSAPFEVRKASTPIFQVNGSGNVDMEGSLDVAGPAKLAIPTAQATATPGLFINSLAVSAPLEIQKASTKIFQVAGSGNVYVLGTLDVTGASTLTGALAANGGIAVDSPAFTVADTSGNVGTTGTLTVGGLASLNGGLAMDTSAFTVANTSGNTQIAGTLGVTGTTALVGALAADGGITVDTSNFTVNGTTGATLIAGALTANGGITADSGVFSVADTSGAVQAGGLTVGVSGTGADVTFYSATTGDLLLWDASEECLDITGTASQNALRVLDGNASFADDVTVTGATALNGGLTMDATAFAVANTSGNTQIGGTLGVTGTTTLTGAAAAASTLSVGTFLILTPASVVEVTEGSTITALGTYQVITSTGVVSTSLVTAIADGSAVGQLLLLQNGNASDKITIVHNANVILAIGANVELTAGRSLWLIWNGTDWRELLTPLIS